MSRRSDGVIKTVGSVLLSEMGGQIRQGDSIGAWTYSHELHTGRLPLQKWSKAEEHDVVSAILDFVKGQKYEKQPVFATVRPALEKVIKDSGVITVILVSSGEEPIAGTPFDEQINELYKTWRVEQEKAHMPLVTVLRAKRGTIVSYSVTPSPWQVDLPAWPREAVAKTEPVAKTQPPAPSKTPPSTASPLIFTGKNPKPAETTNSEAITAASANASPASSTPVPSPAPIVPVVPIVSDPSPSVTSPKPPTNSVPDAAIVERKIEQLSETVQHPSETAPIVPNEPVVTSASPKRETASPTTDTSGPSDPAPVEAPRKPAPSSQDLSVGVASPGNRLFSSKSIWLAGVAVLGLACIVFIVIARRPRSEPISLITRSLEREKE